MDRRPRVVKIGFSICLLALWLQSSCSDQQPSASLAETKKTDDTLKAGPVSSLPLYELRVDKSILAVLEGNAFSGKTHPATLVVAGKEYPVRIRNRGAWARSWPKKAFKIFFEKGDEFEGNHCLNLNSGWRDPAFIREPLAYHVYAACGVPSPRCRLVRLHVNGEFYGLYVEVEQPDKPFLKRNHLKGASIYKANSPANMADERDLGSETVYWQHYEKENRKSEKNADLPAFCHELATTANVVEFFNQRVALDQYISYLAATALVQNWDGFNKNHFLLHESAGKWFAVPWDLDRTFGDHWNGSFVEAQLPLLMGTAKIPGVTGWNRMADRFLSNKTLRTRFLDRLQQLLDKEFTEEKLIPVVDHLAAEIDPFAGMDRQRWPGASWDLHKGVAEVKGYIQERRAFLLREVARLRRS